MNISKTKLLTLFVSGFFLFGLTGVSEAANYSVLTTTTTVDGDTFCGGKCDSGDTIIIKGGARGKLLFKDFDGAGSYITITNENTNPDKRVVITTGPVGEAWAGLELRDCKYVNLRGNNDADLQYGIKTDKVWVRQESDHIKIGYLEIDSSGIMVHDGTLSASWIFDTFEIHHNYIHDVGYAGMYLGQNKPWDENTPYVANFLVHDNLLENMGCYGITLKGVHETSGVMKIYDNTIRVTGVACSTDPVGASSFRQGIGSTYYLGDTYAEIYGNRIEHAAGPGITLSRAAHKVYDNLILGCGTDTIEKLEHGITTYSVNGGEIYDNIIIQPKGYGIYTLGSCANVKLSRNLIGDAGSGEWGELEAGAITESTGADANIYHADVADFNFKAWTDNNDYSDDDFTFSTPPVTCDYYIKNGGNNGLDGKSDATAWATIGKVNSQNFANNDVICFKRDSIFTDTTLTLNTTSVGRSGITVQDYGTGAKPWINGNSVQPIVINHALVNLTLKNIDVSGSDTSGNRCLINNVNGIVIDGIDYDGHTGSSSYVRSTAMAVSRVDGDIEIKNCTIKNVMKDTFANSLSAWGINDAHGLIMYYAGDDNVKSSGTVSIHDNVIHDIYSDCMQLAGMNTKVSVYDNELYDFGENAIDMKHSKYIDFYRNTVYQNDYGAAGGSGYYGPVGIVSGASANWATFMPSNNTIRENYIHTTKYAAIQTPGANTIIKNNYIKNCTMGVIIANTEAKVYNNIFELTTGKPTVEPYASRWIGTMLSGIRVSHTPKTNSLIYNNTFYISSSNHLYGIAVQADADVTGTIIKNNIIHTARDNSAVYPLYIEDYDNSGNLPTVQNNLLYGAHSNRVRIEETPGTWKTYSSLDQALWQSAGHLNALFADPLFTNPAAGNLTLQSISPAIDKGANLGSLYNQGLNSLSTWPNNVHTLDQNSYGSWEIGAYVYASVPIPDPDPTCESQSGDCCNPLQFCLGGSSVASSDCGDVCCVGGTCKDIPPATTCLSEGYQCCAVCYTKAYPEYNGSCSGKKCCAVCSVSPIVDLIPPTAPANLEATGFMTTPKIGLKWLFSTDNIGVAGYRIYRDGVEIATTSSTHYNDHGISFNITYTYTVSAYDAAGNESAQSNSASAMSVPLGVKFKKGVSVSNLTELVGNLLTWVLSIAGSLALLVIIFGGIMYMGSAGDEQKIVKAKKIVYWAIGGLLLILIAYSAALVLEKILS